MKFSAVGGIFFVFILLTIRCKTPYSPGVISSPGQYLVVEGIINSGSDSTIIKLSYTVNLSSTVTLNPVAHAVVAVQSDQNTTFPLTETSNGNYVSPGLNLNSANKYRLSIKTANNEQYYSDYVPVLNSPPLDSVYFTVGNNGIVINTASHDPTNAVQYYRWDFQETWIIHSNYDSHYKSTGDTIVQRNLNTEQIYMCWASDSSSNIILNSTARLKSGVITNNPITSVGSTSEKLGDKYSIIVRQYALTGDAYSFWTNLKKNTEQLGSIFDAQPSQIAGNIHSANNPAEPIIGYISVGSVSQQRIFILNTQLPAWASTTFNPSCMLDTELYCYKVTPQSQCFNQVAQFFYYTPGSVAQQIPVDPVAPPGGAVIGYSGSIPECVDCTLRGTNRQPAYWK
jgi:Domain of unknown function (DUF4249)